LSKQRSRPSAARRLASSPANGAGARRDERPRTTAASGRRPEPDLRSRPSGVSPANRAGSALPTPRAHRSTARRPLLIALVALILALGLLAGRWLRHRDVTGSAATWEQPENPEEARLLREALARPADGRAQEALARYYLAARRPFEALWALQRAREAAGNRPASRDTPSPNTPHPTPRTDLTLAMTEALEAAGLRDRALGLLTEPGAADLADPAVAIRRAELQLQLGRPEAAVRILRPLALTRRPVPPAAGGWRLAILLGRALEAAGDDAGALAQYRRAVAADASSAEAHLRLGRLLVRRGQEDEGRAALATAHRLALADPEPPYALGMSFMAEVARRPAPAARWFNEALRIAPEFGPAHVALGRLALRHRQWKPAAEQFEQALRGRGAVAEAQHGLADLLAATGDPAGAHQRRGMADVLEGKLPQALAEFRALKTAEPRGRTAPILISQTLIQMQRSAEAASEVEALAAARPRDTELKQRLAQLYIDSLTRDAAQRLCEEWRQMDPTAATPLWLLGRTLIFTPGQLSQAIDLYERAAQLAPQDPEIQYALGEALFRSGPRYDPRRALALVGRAIELSPREAKYRYRLGLMLQQLDHPEAARCQLLRALDLSPTMTAACVALVQVFGKLGERGQVALYTPVIRDLQQAKRVEAALRQSVYQLPAEPSGYAALARCLADRGDLPAARAQWEVSLTLRSGDGQARRELARLDRILDVL
jgi:tetratricopeptide (TPR) repeat protein